MTKKDKEIVALIRSGNFTLHYHDQKSSILLRGKHKIHQLEKLSDERIEELTVKEYDSNGYVGYLPEEVIYLVTAIGGMCNSI